MKKFFYIFSIFLLAAVGLFTACTDADEPAQPAGPRTYRLRLLADLQIPGAFATRAAYTFPDKAQLYVLFHQGSAAVTGTAVYDASSGLWTITPSQSLSEVTDGSCRLTYLIDAGQASASSVAVTQSTRIYADGAASFSLAADLLTVQAHLTPTLGRIRFRGSAGQTCTFTGLALATTFDVKTHSVNSVPTKLTATCAADGYTPYFYATFADAATRQLTFEFNATTGFRRAFGESVLQAGVSGYITIPTAEKHDGWTLVNLSTGKEVTFATVSKPTASNVLSDRATLSATVTSTGGGTLTDAGFVIATHATPTISDRRISLGNKTTLSSVISQLTPNTKYYIRAYAVNELGVAYGEEISITTGTKEESDVERDEWGNEENWDNDGNTSQGELLQEQIITVRNSGYRDNITMKLVMPGTFIMGTTEESKHQVTITKPYYVAETEVTQGLWALVRGNYSGTKETDELPQVDISWEECQTFIAILNALTGKQFRMLTEAEWEFAARGGNASMGYTYSGSNDMDLVGWYSYNSDNKTHNVATKAPNELGLYDMSGNVGEWCQDWYGEYATEPQVDPVCTVENSSKVYRGGNYATADCRVTGRYRTAPNASYNFIGLRLAM